MEIVFLGHASFLIKENATNIYIDPYHIIGKLPKADMVLITHPHFDHCSTEDILKISSETTVLISPAGCDVENIQLQRIAPGEEKALKDAIIRAVPAYNIGKNFHPKENNWVGYVIDIGQYRLYHAGDTDVIPEMENLSVDIALLPIGGTYTMDVSEALEAVKKIEPKVAIPMHFGDIVGTVQDAINFCQKCSVKCKMLSKGESWTVDF
ncbi:MBL fold metallo-hydrolase [bacterium]|nr:MBL fold metallo-hydrolase [bacterium]